MSLLALQVQTADPTQSTASVPGVGSVGVATALTIQARDELGLPMAEGGDTVVVSVTGANTASPTVTDNGDGTYSASYTPANAGADSLAITINGQAISGSPFTSTVGGAASMAAAYRPWRRTSLILLLSPQFADPSQSGATIPAEVAGVLSTITVTVRDTDGQQVPEGGDTVAVSVTGANTATASIVDNGDGTYTATYTPTTAGTNSIAVTVNGQPVGGSPFTSVVTDPLSGGVKTLAAIRAWAGIRTLAGIRSWVGIRSFTT